MNRIILIGNGFDLAHGMKTSYRDFIDDFWESEKIRIYDKIVPRDFQYKDEFIELKSRGTSECWEKFSSLRGLGPV
jgi:hypothetical protein